MDKIVIKNVSKQYYDIKGNPFLACDNISFLWNQGQNISIIGESGSGKSTLARLIIGLEKLTFGDITFDDTTCVNFSYKQWRRIRKKVQAVFQDAQGTMNPAYSVFQNVEEALKNLTTLSKNERRNRIYELMEMTYMDKKLLKVPVGQLSGGEQRRLALLRALSVSPRFLILDEVTSGLDLISQEAVVNLLESYHQEKECSYLLITHDKNLAYRMSDQIIEMKQGKITQIGVKTYENNSWQTGFDKLAL